MKRKITRRIAITCCIITSALASSALFASTSINAPPDPDVYSIQVNWELNRASSVEHVELFYTGNVQIRSSDKHTMGGYATKGTIWYTNTVTPGEVSTPKGLGPNDNTIRKNTTTVMDLLNPIAPPAKLNRSFVYDRFSDGVYPMLNPLEVK